MKEQEQIQKQTEKCTNLDFLKQLTKGNPKMIMEMVKVYLEETPKLMDKIRQSIDSGDWDSMGRAAHSLIPSFSTMGMDKEYAVMAKKIQIYAEKKGNLDLIKEMFLKMDSVFTQACRELEQDLVSLEKL